MCIFAACKNTNDYLLVLKWDNYKKDTRATASLRNLWRLTYILIFVLSQASKAPKLKWEDTMC